MSREWKTVEATERLDFLYECLVGDTDRSAIQIPVAIDGLTVATQIGGAAEECITLLGGLTVDQLRWIYSDYSDAQLEETGWDPSSLKNSDRDSSTHLWNELDERCQRSEVRIAGPDDQSGTFEYFLEAVLSDHEEGESFDVNRALGYFSSAKDEDLVSYLQDYDGAISFFGYSYYYQYKENLYAVAVKNSEGVYVAPTDETIGDGTYNPLARRIYMNLLNDEATLKDTVPFVTFGLSTAETLVPVTGYIVIPAQHTKELIERLKDAPYGTDQSMENDGLSTGAMIGIVVGVVVGTMTIVAVLAIFLFKNKEKTGHPEQPL
jgi:phosphate transport system substrate-binding protein